MGNISEKIWGEDQNTHFMLNNNLLFQNLAVYDVQLKYMVETDWPQMTDVIRRMRFAC